MTVEHAASDHLSREGSRGGEDEMFTNASDEVWAPATDTSIQAGATIEVVGPFEGVQSLKRVCGITHDLVRAAPKPLPSE